MSQPASWWLLHGSAQHGPYSHQQLVQELAAGNVSWATLARRNPTDEWKPLGTYPEFHAPASPTPGPPPAVPSSAGGWAPLAITAGAFIVVLGFCCAGALVMLSSTSSTQEAALAQIKAQDAVVLEQNKQELFNMLHPIGTAKSAVLHDVAFASSPAGQPQLVYRFTIYWEGPITKNGYTNVQTVLDLESAQLVDMQILQTNGTTNAEAEQMAFEIGRFLGELARQQREQQQREQLIRSLYGR